MLIYFIFGISAFFIFHYCIKNNYKSTESLYYRPRSTFFKIKFWIFYLLLKLRQKQNRSNKNVTGAGAGYGMRSRSTVKDMEQLQPLPKEHLKAVDAVYFNGANEKGYFIVAATARRHNNLVQTLLYIRIPDIGLLEMTSLPDTSLESTDDQTYAAGGLVITVQQPMKQWTVKFNGQMRLTKVTGQVTVVPVTFDLTWTACTSHFDFDTDLHPRVLCDAIATENWTRNFFQELKMSHQTHYEQFGRLSGPVDVEGYKTIYLDVCGVRDHSYGNVREWRDFHRYAIQYATLKNGTCICVGNICIPKTMSRLIIGYVFTADGKMNSVSSSDLYLQNVGEDGNDPDDMTLSFAAGGRQYKMKIHVVDRPIFYMGKERETRIHERMCEFDVDGIKGWGISEWCYRNYGEKLTSKQENRS